ncbi:hypothetical protein RSOLAG1IB_04310 [Rhizoctonia solani AG-1 IB]|uniref:BTB domain-containing protein n=1 Tax=Thanatephorus cucumeris (strain AG1-IB / isolate 7/3/14) TaxID=1108050 RepID=A0A0B7FTR0_THACB|nr:hypothetical protein RSOLAG1IB_04310 [Rhizoctonia solani AG-1 IB]
MSSNPANILIARSSRSSNTLSALVPTETHAAASAIFPRSSSSPPWLLEEAEVEDIDEVDASDENADTEPIEVDITFRRDASYVGTVKIIVEATTFWAHKDILMFASPFFEAVLSGNWAETSASKNRTSCSSIITISQPPSQPSPSHPSQTEPAKSAMPNSSDELDEDCVRVTFVDTELSSADESEGELAENKEKERMESLKKLQGSCAEGSGRTRSKTAPELSRTNKRRSKPVPDAVIQLKEEKAGIFHDFLKFVYPHLECTVAWNNVEGLMNISHKLVVPSLQTACLQFLLTHAAGKPIKAMRIAELFEHEELYRESSRFVLDNPGGWSEAELSTLSQETLLKLEKRRNWFLERVLKLGLIQVAREYQCSSTCPDPTNCARQLEEKWRLGYHALFRFGPAQPSMVFRYLRQLEGVSPPLSLTHLACQNTAKAWVATLFDRMFSIGLRGSNENATIGPPRVTTSSHAPRRHFLFCTLRPEKEKKGRSMSRDITSALAGTTSA